MVNNNSNIHAQRQGVTESDFSLIAAGDWGCDEKAQRTVMNIQNKKPDLVLALGDLSYQKHADCWFDMMGPLLNKTKIAIGDHEYHFKNSSRFKQYVDKFHLVNQYYSFNYENIHFLGMSAEIPFDKNSKQYKFVESDLKSASSNTSIQWIIVFMYELIYSSPTFHTANENLRDTYHPLFDKYHVDLVLQAHSHNYQRSFPISYNDNKPSSPTINARDKEEYSDPKGSIFVVAGTGGADLHNFTGQEPYIVTQFQRFGFLKLDTIQNGTTLVGTFYENREAANKDNFIITKSLKEEK
ncbi:MAG TPA: metallophosphoesterase [Nitrososphaeraceae archaeon]|jgi:predicted MPP superfamily phosphohydrolase